MQRRTLLQWVASAAAALPIERVRVWAQPRELSPDAIAALHEIAPTVLPTALGADRIRATVDGFVAWTAPAIEPRPAVALDAALCRVLTASA